MEAGTCRQEGQQLERSPVVSVSFGKEHLGESAAVCSMSLDSRRGTPKPGVFFK